MKLENAFCEDLYETCSSRLCYYKGSIRVVLAYLSSIHRNVCT